MCAARFFELKDLAQKHWLKRKRRTAQENARLNGQSLAHEKSAA